MLHSDWFSLVALVSANVSITMMQGDNGNIKVTWGITSFTNYLVIYMIYCCGVVFCLYNVMALYNIPFGFKIFALLTCISKTNWVNFIRLYIDILTCLSRELLNLSHRYKYLQLGIGGNMQVGLKCCLINVGGHMMDIHVLQAVLIFISISRCVVSHTLPLWCSNLAEMSFHILAGDSWTVYGDFDCNSSSVMYYLVASLGKFFPFGWNHHFCYCYCIGRGCHGYSAWV